MRQLARRITTAAATAANAAFGQKVPSKAHPHLVLLPSFGQHQASLPTHKVESAYTQTIDQYRQDMGALERLRCGESNNGWLNLNLEGTSYLGSAPGSDGGKTSSILIRNKVTLKDICTIACDDRRLSEGTIHDRLELMFKMDMVFTFSQMLQMLRLCRSNEAMFEFTNVLPVRIGHEYFWAIVRAKEGIVYVHFSDSHRSRGFDQGIRVHVKNPFSENRLTEILACE